MPHFLKMKKGNRALGFDSTKVVESQNRRGNLLCGIHLRPAEAAKRLGEVHDIKFVEFALGSNAGAKTITKARPPRTGRDSTLRPSGL